MTWLLGPFWNEDERRVRALWRLLLHGVAMYVFSVPIGVLFALIGLMSAQGLTAINTSLQLIVVLLATMVCARWLDHRPFQEFGLRSSPRWWADFAVGLVIGAVVMTGIFVFELEAGWVTIVGRNIGPPGGSFWVALIEPLMLFIAVGIGEELMSRGYHLRNLVEGLRGKWLGPRGAVIAATLISSAIFGLMHATNDNATAIATFNVALAGVMLAIGVLFTGELAIPIGLHISWNFFQGNVFGFPVSGNPMSTRVFAIVQGGDPVLTGGKFGPEAGVIGLVAMLFTAGLIVAWIRLSRGELRLELFERERL